MKVRVASPREFYAGLLFFAIGLAALIVARNYRIGSMVRMGPGYFPLVLSLLLMVLGAASSLRAVRIARGAPIGEWRLVPLIRILLGVVAFGLLVERAGLVAAVIALLVIGAWPRLRSQAVEVLITIVVLTASAVGLFVYGLGMPFSLF
jgi:hypothetical protein